VETEIQSKTGKKYLIKPNKNGGWKVIRSDTRSEENVSDSLIRRTRIRLESGEEIPFRKIDYTVAKETAVVHILKDIINVDHVKKTYSLIKGSSYKKTLFSWEIINRNVVKRYVNKSLYSQGTVVPIDLYSFFELEDMDFGNSQFDCAFDSDNNELDGVSEYWVRGMDNATFDFTGGISGDIPAITTDVWVDPIEGTDEGNISGIRIILF